MNLRGLIKEAEKTDLLKTVKNPVSTRFELANVAPELDGQLVLFENIDRFPLW